MKERGLEGEDQVEKERQGGDARGIWGETLKLRTVWGIVSKPNTVKAS